MQSYAQNDFPDMQLYSTAEDNERQDFDNGVAQQQPHDYNYYQPHFYDTNLPPAPAPPAAGDAFPGEFVSYAQPHYDAATLATPGSSFIGDAYAADQFGYPQLHQQGDIPQGAYAHNGGNFGNNFGELPAIDETFDGFGAWPSWGVDASVQMQMQAEMQLQAQWQWQAQMQARAQMQAQAEMQVRAQLQAQAQMQSRSQQPIPDFAPNHAIVGTPFFAPDCPPTPAPATQEDDFDTKPQADDAGLAELFAQFMDEQAVTDYRHNNTLYQDMLSTTEQISAFPVNDLASFPVNYVSAKAAQDAALNRTSDYGREMHCWVPTGTQHAYYLEQAGSPAQDDLSQPIQQLDCQAEAVGQPQEIDQPMVIASAKEEPATPEPLFSPAFVAEPLRTRAKVPRKPWAVRGEIAVVDIKDGKGAKIRYGENATPVVLYVQAARSAGVGKSNLPGYQPKDQETDAQILCPVHGCRRTYGSVRAAERHIDCSKESAHRVYAESVEYSRVRRFTKWKTEHKCRFCEWETKSGRSDAVTRHEKLHLPGGSLHNLKRRTARKGVEGSSGGEQSMAM